MNENLFVKKLLHIYAADWRYVQEEARNTGRTAVAVLREILRQWAVKQARKGKRV